MNKLYFLAILALSIAAIFLSLAIAQELGWELPLQKPEAQKVMESTSSSKLRKVPSNLKEEEKFLYSPPNKDDPKANAEFNKKLEVLAIETDTLNLNKCEKPDPLVVKIKQGQKLTIKNSDSVAHQINMEKFLLTVDKESSVTIKAGVAGSYGYGCDSLEGIVGFILVHK